MRLNTIYYINLATEIFDLLQLYNKLFIDSPELGLTQVGEISYNGFKTKSLLCILG